MAYTFEEKPVATIKAKIAGSTTEEISVGGVTTGTTTVDNAVAQINKILDIAGKSVQAGGMIRVRIEEATENE